MSKYGCTHEKAKEWDAYEKAHEGARYHEWQAAQNGEKNSESPQAKGGDKMGIGA